MWMMGNVTPPELESPRVIVQVHRQPRQLASHHGGRARAPRFFCKGYECATCNSSPALSHLLRASILSWFWSLGNEPVTRALCNACHETALRQWFFLSKYII